jgi:hypothetical protein
VAYSPPSTFADGSPLTAAGLKANDDALKVYLHEGVVAGDLTASAWVDTHHIQAPVIDSFSGVQHGVTGFQGSQWDGGALVRCQFGTALLTAKRYGATTADEAWAVIPQTTFSIGLRKTATVVFHWWMESNNGPDDGTGGTGASAYMWVSEYTSSGALAATGAKAITTSYSQECINNHLGFVPAVFTAAGPVIPYTLLGYGNMSGTSVFGATDNLAVGLAHISQIDRSAIINWGISLEVYY